MKKQIRLFLTFCISMLSWWWMSPSTRMERKHFSWQKVIHQPAIFMSCVTLRIHSAPLGSPLTTMQTCCCSRYSSISQTNYAIFRPISMTLAMPMITNLHQWSV